MKFKVEEIASVIKQELAQFEDKLDVSEVGRVLEIGDGIARIYGLDNAMASETLQFESGVLGQVFNLEEGSIGAVVYGDYLEIKEGDEVRCTGELLSVPVGREMLGRVVDPLGLAIDDGPPISGQTRRLVEMIAPGITDRQLSLLLRRPPGREAYPGDVFYLHSRLLERAVKLNDEMYLTILTPEIEKFRGDTVEVVLPGHDGLLEILPNHAPLLCNLDIGLVRFLDTGKVQHGFMLDGGFAHIRDNQIMVLTRKAVGSNEITTTQAEERLKRAKELPKTNLKEVDGRNAAIKRAKLYIDLASLK